MTPSGAVRSLFAVLALACVALTGMSFQGGNDGKGDERSLQDVRSSVGSVGIESWVQERIVPEVQVEAIINQVSGNHKVRGPRIAIHFLASDGVARDAEVSASAVVGVTPIADATLAPETVQTVTPDARYLGFGVERWRSLVASVFGAENVEYALYIMRCESGGNPDAMGAQGERGLFQIHPRWHPDATYDPLGNIRAAYRISSGGTDWSAWTCR